MNNPVMFNLRILIPLAVAFIALSAYLLASILASLQPERNDIAITITDPDARPISLRLAVVADTHTWESAGGLETLRQVLLDVREAKPDFVVFVGDYIFNLWAVSDPETHRENITEIFTLSDPLPRALVLGNHETDAGIDAWFADFEKRGIDVLENEIKILDTPKGAICIRALGDFRTKRYRYIDYPESCRGLPKLTITHDPAGSFHEKARGLFISGHTHCGQISFPIVGPLWYPTTAPRAARCGLYEDDLRTVFVTSGVGTSIIPVRYGTQAQWDMMELTITGN